MDRKRKPTKELLVLADNEDLCLMVRLYRDTPHHSAFLKLLFNMPIEVWTENNLKADDILREFEREEEDKLLDMYEKSGDFKQHPLITLIQYKRKKAP